MAVSGRVLAPLELRNTERFSQRRDIEHVDVRIAGSGGTTASRSMTRNRSPSGSDVAVWFGELDELDTDGLRLVRDLDPQMVWLPHEHAPWRSPTE